MPENDNPSEADKYLELYNAEVINLEKSFEDTFCSYQKRFEPIMELIGHIIPTYNDTEIATCVTRMKKEKFGLPLIENLREMLWSSLLEVVYDAHEMTSEVETVKRNREYYFERIVKGQPFVWYNE